MTAIITLYVFGIIAAIGALCGATHYTLPAAVCIIIATRLLQDWREERKKLRRGGGLI